MTHRFARCACIAMPLCIALIGAQRLRADEADDQYAVAAGHYAAQRWALAVGEFRTLIKDHPDHPKSAKSLFFLGEALVQLGKYEEAGAEFNRFLGRDPQSTYATQALFRAGETAFMAGQREAARKSLEDFRDKYPDDKLNAYVLMYLGEIALTDKDVKRAESLLGEALERFPSAAPRDEIRFGLARTAELKGNQTAAEKMYGELATGHDEGFAAQAKSRLAMMQLAKASSLIAADKFAPAADALEAYLKSQPDGEFSDRALAQVAVCYARTKRLDDARDAFAQFNAKQSRSSRGKGPSELSLATTQQLAEAALAAGDSHWARELFSALAADGVPPEYAVQGLSGLGWCQLQAGENDKAAATFDRLLDQFPDGPAAAEAAWARGQVLERLKRFDAALDSYQLIVEKHASSKRFEDAALAAARLHSQLRQDAQSIELYQRLIHECPDSAQIDAARYGLAWALRDSEKRPEADEQFQKLHDDFRRSRFWNDATFRLAESALEAKQSDRAERLLDELTAAKPPADILQHALYLEGQAAAADQKWDRVAAVMGQLARDYPDSSLRLPAEYWIAESAYRQARFDDAGKRFAALSDQIAGRKDKWLAMVPLRRAQVLAQKKQWADAQAIAARIEIDFPDFSEQYEADYLLGRALAAQADFDGARKRYQRVFRSASGGKTETAAMAQWMIGESYFHQEDYEAALREYLRVEILYPYPRWQAAALLQAGKCQESLDRWKDAAELYARLIKVYSNTEFTDEATRRLRDVESRTATAARKSPD